jgi:hypothetical protein
MFNRNDRERERTVRHPHGTAVAEREHEHEHATVPVHDEERRHEHGRALGLDRERQHDEFGGFNLGAAFFGWLVAIGLAALLTALLSAAGAAIGLTEVTADEASSSAETLSIVGAVLLVLVLALSYYAGGYVAGRMSRFDGGRQGLGVWGIGLAVTILLGLIGAVAGTEYNVLGSLDLPRLPIDEGSLATGALITLAAIIVLTALAAMAGGKAGERYHRRVDAVGLHRDRI